MIPPALLAGWKSPAAPLAGNVCGESLCGVLRESGELYHSREAGAKTQLVRGLGGGLLRNSNTTLCVVVTTTLGAVGMGYGGGI